MWLGGGFGWFWGGLGCFGVVWGVSMDRCKPSVCVCVCVTFLFIT